MTNQDHFQKNDYVQYEADQPTFGFVIKTNGTMAFVDFGSDLGNNWVPKSKLTKLV